MMSESKLTPPQRSPANRPLSADERRTERSECADGGRAVNHHSWAESKVTSTVDGRTACTTRRDTGEPSVCCHQLTGQLRTANRTRIKEQAPIHYDRAAQRRSGRVHGQRALGRNIEPRSDERISARLHRQRMSARATTAVDCQTARRTYTNIHSTNRFEPCIDGSRQRQVALEPDEL
jgi:hypothetical protein